jgi:hypothetical protein
MQKGGQELPQAMDQRMSHVLRAQTQMEHGNHLAAGIDGEPEPEDLLGVAQPGAQFIQLEMREAQVAEETLVQGLRVSASAGQKGS